MSDKTQNTITVRHQLTHDTADNWSSHNPSLLDGELVVVTENYTEENVEKTRTRLKIGRGEKTFQDVPYVDEELKDVLGVEDISSSLSTHMNDATAHLTEAERETLSGLQNYTHPESGVDPGTYRSVTVDAEGHVTAGSNPTTLSAYGIGWNEASFGNEPTDDTETAVTTDTGTVQINLRGESYTVLTAHQDLSNKIDVDGGDVSNTVLAFEVEDVKSTGNYSESQTKPPLNIGEKTDAVDGKFTLSSLFSRIKYWFAELHEVAFSGKYANLEHRPSLLKTVTITGDATGSANTAAVTASAEKDSAYDAVNQDDYTNAVSVNVTLVNSGVEAGTYGQETSTTIVDSGSFQVPTYTVDAKGRVTDAETVTIQLQQTPHIYVGTFSESDWDKNASVGAHTLTIDATQHGLQGVIVGRAWGTTDYYVKNVPVYAATYAAISCGFSVASDYTVTLVSSVGTFAGMVELISDYSATSLSASPITAGSGVE
jgi:hypothetical protein